MPPRPKKPKPFDVDFDQTELEQLGHDLCREIDDALSARSAVIADGGLIDFCDWYYEQGRSNPKDLPFPGAADLTSYFITVDVDALRARLMKAVFGINPFCFVEGWGASAVKAPFVEAFHDWQVHEGGLIEAMGKTVHGGLIEDAYILEVTEKVETRRLTEQFEAKLQLSPEGGALFQDGQPLFYLDEVGDPVPAQPGEPSATVERTSTKTKRLGPQYDAISMKDFVFLPGHAKSHAQVWGYAYRFWARIPELAEQVKDGIYDKAAVAEMGDQSDRDLTSPPSPGVVIASQQGPSVEKELFQVSLKRDLDGDGREEWYVATVNRQSRVLLRLKLDTFVQKVGIPRCVPFVFFPRRNSVYGYSFAGDKIMTLAEEHTATRNMKADRSALATNAPIKKTRNSHWDPDLQPLGVGAVITVGDQREIEPMLIPDVPASIVEQENSLHTANERVSGLSDAFQGLLSRTQRTLGENKLAAGGSAVRVDEVVGHLHRAIAHVMKLSHAIWIETLEADPKGIEAPSRVLDALKERGQELANGRFTVEQLKGDFQFKPYGSDENADPEKEKANFNNGVEALANIAKVCPALMAVFQSPEVAKAFLEQWLRVYKVRDRQPFLGAFNQAPMLPPAAGPGAAMPMGAPAGPPGTGPPPPGPPGVPGLTGAPTDITALLAMLQGPGSSPTGVM